jgi:hypothetical protein
MDEDHLSTRSIYKKFSFIFQKTLWTFLSRISWLSYEPKDTHQCALWREFHIDEYAKEDGTNN